MNGEAAELDQMASPIPPARPAAPAGLKRLLDQRPAGHAEERCELCAVAIGREHRHAVNVTERSLLCVCTACYLLFTQPGAAGGRYQAVPDRYLALGDDLAFASLDVPVGVAFFFVNSPAARLVGFYPSPAGATESLLPMDAWQESLRDHPVLATLAPDVEALLVRRTQGHAESFIVPIADCYELVGLVRRHWQGFSGGPDAEAQLDAFFARIRGRSRTAAPERS